FRHLRILVEHKCRPRHRIVNHHKRARRSRCGQRPHARQRDFPPRASLAVAEHVGLHLTADGVAIGQGLPCFRNRHRAVWRARYDFSGVHFAEAQNLHSRPERSPPPSCSMASEGGAPAGGSCARNAPTLTRSAPLSKVNIRLLFIISSPLLSQTAAILSRKLIPWFAAIAAPSAARRHPPTSPLGSSQPRVPRLPSAPGRSGPHAASVRARPWRPPASRANFPATA